jgi:acyl-CoA thioesterase FadM
MIVQVPLRRCDVDDMGHVAQHWYHQFLGEARTALLNVAGGATGFVLGYVELRYLAETMLADGPMEISIHVTEVGNSSVKLEHEVRTADGRSVARGRSVMVAWDAEHRTKRAVTPEERNRLSSLPV